MNETPHRTVGRHADHHPPAGRKPFAIVCAGVNGHEACPKLLRLIPVVIDDQHSAATG